MILAVNVEFGEEAQQDVELTEDQKAHSVAGGIEFYKFIDGRFHRWNGAEFVEVELKNPKE